MTGPVRIQRRRTAGWRMPDGTVYVGRPTRWGNPFVVGAVLFDGVYPNGEPEVRDRAHAVELFRGWLVGPWVGRYLGPRTGFGPTGRFAQPLPLLRGRDLACWCPLDQPYHADVLLEVANR